ncbi:MAG: SDR family NAD(P)-dependent oxidoreductase [Phycisphaeraceae bacterium]|nr:SDR family NAD(P)-dependent oxidoreductase [Phycisphaeraceae bacterium]
MARDLQNKVILITGASSGIGEATALACAEAGMRVSLVARRGDKLQGVAARVAATGHKANFFTADVCNTNDMRQAFADCWATFGRLDAVFANAGYGQIVDFLDMTEIDERAMFETNYFGTTRALRMAVPLMRQTPGGLNHLLVCSSAASEIGLPTLGVYSATKAAQDSVAGALRAELHDEGFKVTSVHPIGTKTGFMQVAGNDQNKNTPAALQQTPEKVARHIVAVLRKPKPEVWTSRMTRVGLALGTLSPRFASWAMRRHYRKLQRAMGGG